MNTELVGALEVFAAALFWSAEGVISKSLPWSGLTIFGLRNIVCVLALRLTRRSTRVRLTPGTLLGALGMSLTGLLYTLSLKLTTAANAIVLQYAMPAIVILLCAIVLKQKPDRTEIVTMLCVLAGVVLCAWNGLMSGGGRLTGDLLALLSALTYSLFFFSARLPGGNARDYSYLGALMSVPYSIYAFFDPAMTVQPKHIAAIVALGLCVAGGYFFISLSLNHVHPVTSALLANLEPALSPLWAYLVLGEDPGVMTIIGAAVIILSVSVYSARKAKAAKP